MMTDLADLKGEKKKKKIFFFVHSQVLNEWVINHLKSDKQLIETARALQSESVVCIACLGILQESFNSWSFLGTVSVVSMHLPVSCFCQNVICDTVCVLVIEKQLHLQHPL